jgi:hypothetical protein
MEAVYFVGALILLTVLIYGTLNWHYRDRRQARKTDQIVRDRYAHKTNLIKTSKPQEPVDGREPDFSEDDIQREQLGPRGVPGKADPAKMTPQREKKQPKHVDPGHTA